MDITSFDVSFPKQISKKVGLTYIFAHGTESLAACGYWRQWNHLNEQLLLINLQYLIYRYIILSKWQLPRYYLFDLIIGPAGRLNWESMGHIDNFL